VAPFGIGNTARALRHAPPSLIAVAMMAPVSLLTLQLWSMTPSGLSPDALGSQSDAALVRPIVFLVAWVLMTAAMMLPSAMPLLVALDRMTQNQPGRHTIPVFAAVAYLGIWGLVGIAVWTSSAAATAFILPRAPGHVVTRIVGGCLVLAGLYGLSPLAGACLRACRRPFGFLARYWQGGSGARVQAARVGASYGISCVGCCVPMLGVMFVVGMANLAIVIAMGILMVIMKASSVGTRVAHVLAIWLIGVGIAVGLAWVPLVSHH